ncbi:hypothetical protein SOVF_074100 [Spinacia oleracea]|nr:hypothetical protein SOVF_074100 [Spinacia oleracea]
MGRPPTKRRREDLACPPMEPCTSRKKCKVHDPENVPIPQFNKIVDDYYKACFGGNFVIIRDDEDGSGKHEDSKEEQQGAMVNGKDGSATTSVSFNGLEVEPDQPQGAP